MEWRSVDLANCPISRAVDVLGTRWTLMVLRDAFNGVRRFEDFHRHLAVSTSVLSRRLKDMVDDGLLRREPYRDDGERERIEYHPTDMAWDLYPVIVGLAQWGDRYLGDPDGPPVHFVDATTGSPIVTALVTPDTPSLSPAEVRIVPGASLRTIVDGS